MQLDAVQGRWTLFNAVQGLRPLPTCSPISAGNRRHLIERARFPSRGPDALAKYGRVGKVQRGQWLAKV